MHTTHLRMLTIVLTGKVTWFTSTKGISIFFFNLKRVAGPAHQIPPPDTVTARDVLAHSLFDLQ